MFWIPIAAMAAAGALKSELSDKPRANKQRRLAALTEAYSPWTGLHGGPVQEPDLMRDVMGGAISGASFGQELQKTELAEELSKKMKAGKNVPVSLSLGGSPSPAYSPMYSPYAGLSSYQATPANLQGSPVLTPQRRNYYGSY